MGDPREEQIITPDSMTMALRTAFRPRPLLGRSSQAGLDIVGDITLHNPPGFVAYWATAP